MRGIRINLLHRLEQRYIGDAMSNERGKEIVKLYYYI